MNMTLRTHLPRLIGAVLLLAAGLAQAQWSWIDDKGVRQFSDRPPPPGTPAARILKAPGRIAAPAEVAAAPDAPTLAKREADFIGKVRAMTAKTALDDPKHDKARLRYCQQARLYKDWLTSGAPATKDGEDGARRPMSNEERAKEVVRADAVLASCG